MTLLTKDPALEELVRQQFSATDDDIKWFDILPFLDREFAKEFIPITLNHESTSVRTTGINSIEYLHLTEMNDSLVELINKEKNAIVAGRLLKLTEEFLTVDVLRALLNNPLTSQTAMSLIIASPHFMELIDVIEEKKCKGAELNKVNIKDLQTIDPFPSEFIEMLFKESREFITDATIDSIIEFDPLFVNNKIILPRMNRNEYWRARYNAIKVFQSFARKCGDGTLRPDWAGFILSMCLDHVYQIRKEAFKTLEMFPPSDMTSIVLESLFAFARDDSLPFQVKIVQQLVDDVPSVLRSYQPREKVVSVLKFLKVDPDIYFSE